jgi:membrane associated rhomboid family serine protease
MMPGRDHRPALRVIPLHVDDGARRRAPVMLVLVALNLAAFAALALAGPAADEVIRAHGLVPARLSSAESWRLLGPLEQLGPLVSHAFLHQGALHLITNLWGLWVFGGAVEARVGSRGVLGLYLGALVMAAAAQSLALPGSVVPMIGASGAVAGLMGACLVLQPGAQVLTLIPIPFPTAVRLPLAGLLVAWALFQLLQATSTAGAETGVAWWAHVGGFGAGSLWALAARLPRPVLMPRWRAMGRSLW